MGSRSFSTRGTFRIPDLQPRDSMRLTIFSRVILAQSAVIGLVLLVSVYALEKFNWLTRVQTDLLTIDTACLNEEKRLSKIFLAEMRNAEKYLVSFDKVYYAPLDRSINDFSDSLVKVAMRVDSQREKDLVEEIRQLHMRYYPELSLAVSKKAVWDGVRAELGDGTLERINELIRLREQGIRDKMAAACEHTAAAARTIGFMTMGGVVAALLLAFLHARGVSVPLRRLAGEMQRVGRGEFVRARKVRAAKEVRYLVDAFNRMAEELAELDRLKSDFTAHVSHELRTPLTAIREGTALLLEEISGPLTESQREILGIVHGQSEQLFQGISSILDFSKMQAAMMEYEFTMSDPVAVIRRSVENVGLIARKKGIEVRMDLPEPLPLAFLDERRIEQVLDNLLSNALKFTPDGGDVWVSASLAETEGAGIPCVEVQVSDTGPGIAESDIDKIFNQFYQSPGNAGQNHQGTGLGLAIARHIVEAHGGSIRVDSVLGQGAAFIFSLPVKPEGGSLHAALSKEI